MNTPRRAARAPSGLEPDAALFPAAPTVTLVALHDAGITPDPAKARRHNPRNLGVIEDSMHTDGAGRSILVDQHGVTIAGAGAWEAATHAGSHPPRPPQTPAAWSKPLIESNPAVN